MEMPVTPPSMKLLDRRKPFSPIALLKEIDRLKAEAVEKSAG
jgi:uncharacterized small protein (DUF1192 family)